MKTLKSFIDVTGRRVNRGDPVSKDYDKDTLAHYTRLGLIPQASAATPAKTRIPKPAETKPAAPQETKPAAPNMTEQDADALQKSDLGDTPASDTPAAD
jgi:hypothetical protein